MNKHDDADKRLHLAKPLVNPTPAVLTPSADDLVTYLLDYATNATVILLAVEQDNPENERLVSAINNLVLHPGVNVVGGVLVEMVKEGQDAENTRGVIAALAARKEEAKRATTPNQKRKG
jgi:hypothetical protein